MAAARGEWICERCWYVNDRAQRRCGVCDLERGGVPVNEWETEEETEAPRELPGFIGFMVLVAGALVVLHAAVSVVAAIMFVSQRALSAMTSNATTEGFAIASLGLVGVLVTWLEFALGWKILQGSRTAWAIGSLVAAAIVGAYFAAEIEVRSVVARVGLDPAAIVNLEAWRWLLVAPFAYIAVALLLALLVERVMLLFGGGQSTARAS